MSFILDALKKLEQKRNREEIPDLLTVHPSPVQKPQRRPVWLFIIVTALLLNAAILLAWLKPWQSEKMHVASLPSPEQPEPASSPALHTPDGTEQPASSPVIEKKAESPVPLTETGEPSPDSTQGGENAAPDSLTSKEDAGPALPLPPAEKPDTETPSEGPGISNAPGTHAFLPDKEELSALRGKIKEEIDHSASAASHEPTAAGHPDRDLSHSPEDVIEMSQLPPDIKSELPRISINAHIYSNNPSSRVVNINGVIFREGEDIARGLTLEKITTSGIILTYKNHRFRVRAF